VRTAYSGRSAVSLAELFRPDVALLDIGMPEMDGYAAASAIRQQRGGNEICLIALTGRGHEDDKRRSREAGFELHLTKPVDPDELQRLLVRLHSDHPATGTIQSL
jgi:CheY-like chemotaxis protein